jgi:hypothetical protein
MRWLLVMAGTCWVLGLVPGPMAAQDFTYVDLQPKANQKLTDGFHSGVEGNGLAALPKGEQTFAGIKFKIADGLLQLGSKRVQDKPERLEGIPVGKTFAKLHILHGTGYGGGPSRGGGPLFVADETLIGRYRIHYEDESVVVIPIIYGQHVRDWWFYDDDKGVTRSKVAWIGDNAFARSSNAKIRLYLTTWENPKPTQKVVAMDYVSTQTTAAAPFCVALTLEGK